MEFERRSNRQKKPNMDSSSSFYNLESTTEIVICCICGKKSNNSVSVQERVLSFTTDTLNDLLEKEEMPHEIISAENRACTQCHNILIKILQLLEEIKKYKVKLKHALANRHKSGVKLELSDNLQIIRKGEK